MQVLTMCTSEGVSCWTCVTSLLKPKRWGIGVGSVCTRYVCNLRSTSRCSICNSDDSDDPNGLTIIIQYSSNVTRLNGQMGWASASHMAGHVIQTWGAQTLTESTELHKNWYLLLSSLALGTNRIGFGVVRWGRPIVCNWNLTCVINGC